MVRRLWVLSLCLLSFFSYGKETLRIVYYDSFPPYSYINAAGEMEGILVDIAREVLEKQMNLEVSHEGYPWSRAQRMVFNGQADAFITVPTPERLNYVNVAKEPVFSAPINLFTYKNHAHLDKLEQVSSIEDLKEFVILDYVGNGWGNENFPQDSYTRVIESDLSIALQMLAKKQGDVVAVDKVVAEFLLSKHDRRNLITELPVTLTVAPFALCISKTSQFVTILEEFSEQVLAFRQQGGEREILAKYK
ncbi:transporter substrate-binding domain-containing protein [Vibrio tubiashii]|uniref:Transporter substrate-binding domain-containing protein n=1 Tax=Vibrio tubiashii TaxID=29498 RepID=A0AAE5GLQ9_9VIBR|nr:transporter substrate-binding domain-containing protein [Vibrio tubiashii]NOI79197.1 transporter substrate-binding domain-containing protein [Vibrio tubiashii]